MSVNITSIKIASNGVWQGDNPLHFAFPLLILQSVLILLLSRLLALLLKPLRQPKVIAEIVVSSSPMLCFSNFFDFVNGFF
ncbi:Cation/H(+) antiporter 20, partial [Cucurbita argyrosperma subsp. sororia]